MTIVHLDFETFSTADIRKTGGAIYAEDPSTELLCLSYAVDDEEPCLLTAEAFTGVVTSDYFVSRQVAKRLQGKPYTDPRLIDRLRVLAADKSVQFRAYNAQFEQAIWKNIMVKRFGFAEIPVNRWRCVLAKAFAHGLPGTLDLCGRALNLPIQKDQQGHAIMLKLCRPRRMKGKDRWTPEDAPEDFEKLYKYCITDVKTERLIDRRLRDLSSAEQAVWEIDQRMNQQGLHIDEVAIKAAMQLGNTHLTVIKKKFQEITSIESPTKRKLLLEWFQSQGLDIFDTQKATLAGLLSRKGLSSDIITVLDIVSESTKTSLAKLPRMLELSVNGVMRELVQYHAAHTGRWGGRGAQIQNFPRPGLDINVCVDAIKTLNYGLFGFLYKDVSKALSSALRGMIVAPPGYTLFVSDFSQMEARVLAWLAGQQDVLDLFAAGEDLYCSEASKIFGYTVDKSMKDERQVGKVAVLALGYQGGIGAFAMMAKGYGIDLEVVFNNLWKSATNKEKEKAQQAYEFYRKKAKEPVSKKAAFVADIIKQRWRRGNDKIEAYWTKLEEAAKRAVNTQKPVKCGHVTWFVHKGFLYAKLPSGRCMAYPYPRVKSNSSNPHGKTTLEYFNPRFGHKGTYGGQLCENIVQAVQRDLLSEALVRLEATYKAAFHVHDEVVSEVKLGFGSLTEFMDIMKHQPVWATGLPIGVSGWSGDRYGKE